MTVKNPNFRQLEMNFELDSHEQALSRPVQTVNSKKNHSLTKCNSKLSIHQRRYLGNKHSALSLIDYVIKNKIKTFNSFCDIFAGTGTVGNFYNNENKSIISNDLLFSNYISMTAFLGHQKYNKDKITELIKYFNNFIGEKENYCSEHFGDKYFSMQNAKKIGCIREEIETLSRTDEINFKEETILVTSLMYAMDKIANTVGHYDAYIKKSIEEKILELKMLDIKDDCNHSNVIYNQDANKLIKDISGDVLYIDPPYNSRQYCDNYHLLENIARWEKPEVNGVANKFDRTHLKSKYSLKDAPQAFFELIQKSDFRYILFSYNNMQDKGNSRSNARISDEQIMDVLSTKGEVEIFEQEYKAFTTGKSSRGDNTERIFFVEVKS